MVRDCAASEARTLLHAHSHRNARIRLIKTIKFFGSYIDYSVVWAEILSFVVCQHSSDAHTHRAIFRHVTRAALV